MDSRSDQNHSPNSSSSFLPPFLLGPDHSLVRTKETKEESPADISSSFWSPELKDLSETKSKKASKDGPPTVSLSDYENSYLRNETSYRRSSLESTASPKNKSFQFPHSFSYDRSDNWVTVFGFPPGRMAFVLSHFNGFGNIVTTDVPKNGGNWLDIKYSTKSEADNALARHGKMLDSNLVVGVIPCCRMRGPADVENFPRTSPIMHLSKQPRGIRRLEAGSGLNDEDDDTLPYRSEGFLSKVMDLIFGW